MSELTDLAERLEAAEVRFQSALKAVHAANAELAAARRKLIAADRANLKATLSAVRAQGPSS